MVDQYRTGLTIFDSTRALDVCQWREILSRHQRTTFALLTVWTSDPSDSMTCDRCLVLFTASRSVTNIGDASFCGCLAIRLNPRSSGSCQFASVSDQWSHTCRQFIERNYDNNSSRPNNWDQYVTVTMPLIFSATVDN